MSSISISGTDSAMFNLSIGSCITTLAAGSSCQIGVTFTPSSTGPKTASLDIGSDDPQMTILSIPLSGMGTGSGSGSTITVTFAGSGGSYVQIDPGGIICYPGSPCQPQFANGTSVTLTPSPDLNTLFSWSGPACPSGTGACVINNLSGSTSAIATFTYVNPARVSSSLVTYGTIQGAYNAAQFSNDEIRARSFVFSESPVLAGGKTITINGGCDLNYSPVGGSYSTVSGGAFTIGTGQVTLANIIIK